MRFPWFGFVLFFIILIAEQNSSSWNSLSHHLTRLAPPLTAAQLVLIRRIIQSTVESLSELLHDVAASASVWGAGSLQVLELTSASPMSTCTRWPPSLRPAGMLNPRVYFIGPPSMTPSELTRILLLLVWTEQPTLSLGSPENFSQGPL